MESVKKFALIIIISINNLVNLTLGYYFKTNLPLKLDQLIPLYQEVQVSKN